MIFDWDTVRETVKAFRKSASAAGHDPDVLPIMLQVNGNVTAHALDEADRYWLTRTVASRPRPGRPSSGSSTSTGTPTDDPLAQLPLLAQLGN